ncbi:Crp/Fnr family transcriptional regulator [Propionibacteriaceae bacterium G57]|uniref:Crp/Fnr family transcriptional regulator n=1 Tax=Aestuariimicrobium sp. G57 TaxID=3418485 RepID=UPI003DA76A13
MDDLCVARVPLFQGLSRDDQLEVAHVAHPTALAKGEQVYAAGSSQAQLMVVHTGKLKISRIDAEGREQVLRVLGPGDFFGESAFLTGASPDHFAAALESGSMCVFRHSDLDRLVSTYPSIGFRMLQSVSERLAQTEGRLASLLSGDVGSRLADYLLSLPVKRGASGTVVELPLAKKDVASLLDTTPETLSRQLRRLQGSGVIEVGAGRSITLLDIDALLELSAAG